jgi:alcohol dehydrogenase
MGYNFYQPTKVLFGAGRSGELGDSLRALDLGKKAAIVISNGRSTKENGSLEKVEKQLQSAEIGYVVFDKIQANPLASTIMEGAAFMKENGCEFIVALGGGSVMDASKIIAIMATNPGEVWDYAYGGHGGCKPYIETPLPVVTITTTAGTGSEVDAWGVVNNEKYDEKIGIGGADASHPVLAVVDPELMKTVPAKFTAYQGFDALFHSTECYITSPANLMSDMFALTAIENIGKYLARAVKDGSDMEAREHVAFANTLSGHVMEISACSSEHSMEHAMSAMHHDLPHGAGLIMISLEYYKWFVNHHACDERFVRMAKALGKEEATEPMDFVIALEELQKACGVDSLKMSDYGFTKEEFPEMAQKARDTMGGLYAADRVELSVEETAGIYERSYR